MNIKMEEVCDICKESWQTLTVDSQAPKVSYRFWILYKVQAKEIFARKGDCQYCLVSQL